VFDHSYHSSLRDITRTPTGTNTSTYLCDNADEMAQLGVLFGFPGKGESAHDGMTDVAVATMNHLDTHKLLDMLLLEEKAPDTKLNVDADKIQSKAKDAMRKSQGDNVKLPLKDFELVITGHSLGAGVASLVSLFLHKRFGDRMKCYAFSNPCGLMSKRLSEYCDKFVTSLVVGNDLVGRLSLWTMQQLRNKIVRSERSNFTISCYDENST